MQACLDFGLPYHHYNSWGHAVVAHYEYLKEMGRRLAEPLTRRLTHPNPNPNPNPNSGRLFPT